MKKIYVLSPNFGFSHFVWTDTDKHRLTLQIIEKIKVGLLIINLKY